MSIRHLPLIGAAAGLLIGVAVALSIVEWGATGPDAALLGAWAAGYGAGFGLLLGGLSGLSGAVAAWLIAGTRVGGTWLAVVVSALAAGTVVPVAASLTPLATQLAFWPLVAPCALLAAAVTAVVVALDARKAAARHSTPTTREGQSVGIAC